MIVRRCDPGHDPPARPDHGRQEEGPMQLGRTIGRMAVITGLVLAGAAGTILPAQATTSTTQAPATATWKKPVGPFNRWEDCDYERRVMASRYGYHTYPCELLAAGYYFWYDA
jgi:hypothetical protein